MYSLERLILTQQQAHHVPLHMLKPRPATKDGAVLPKFCGDRFWHAYQWQHHGVTLNAFPHYHFSLVVAYQVV
jgi:hypothetical protein